MTDCISHFVFSDSFAGSLRKALKQAGRDDRVTCFSDNLAFGPINPPNPAARLGWVSRELMIDFDDSSSQIDDSSSHIKALDGFWAIALSTSKRRVVWVSVRVASEYAGFLEWVQRVGKEPYEVIEFTEAEVTYRRPDGTERRDRANVLAQLTADHLEAGHFWDQAKPLDEAKRKHYGAIWNRLRRENSPLRVLTETGLVSAPLSFFDDLLLSCAVDHWRKVARVVGEALSKIWEGQFIQTDDWVLHARVIALAEAGQLESRGDLSRAQFSEVRVPGAQTPA
jgi:hypothetical protein